MLITCEGVTFTSPSAEPVHTPPQPIPLESKAPTAPTAPTVVQAAATQEQTAEVTAQVQEDSSTIHPPPAQPAVSEVVTGEDEDSFASMSTSSFLFSFSFSTDTILLQV